jgi:hypothetical protein
MPAPKDKPVYQALALPNEALTNGGLEILRAGLIDSELYVNARRVFKNPAPWGEVLADIAKRIALLYSAEDTDFNEKEALAEIEEAFAAELGAPVIKDKPKRKAPKKVARKTTKHKTVKHKTTKRGKR